MLTLCFNVTDGELSNFKRKKDKTISKPNFKNKVSQECELRPPETSDKKRFEYDDAVVSVP